MTSFALSAILWLSVVWIVPLIYAMLLNETKPKKNLIMGVTLSSAARADAQVLDLCARFRRSLGWISLALCVLSLPILLLNRFSRSITWMLVWILLACALPYVPYVRCNLALRALKLARGWRQPTPPSPTLPELPAEIAPRRSLLWFLFPLVIGLIPAVVSLLAKEWVMAFVYFTNAALILLFFGFYRCLYQGRGEAVDGDLQLTAARSRLRRQKWGLCWVGLSWLTGLFNLGLWLTREHTWPFLAVLFCYTAGVVLLAAGTEFRLRKLQQNLTQFSGQGTFLDQDDQWIWGLFYYNPNDPHLLVNARAGMNTTFNMARRSGQVLAALIVLSLLCLPLLGVWLIREEDSPVLLSCTDTAILATHSGTRYEIPLDEIDSATLLDSLPKLHRVMGTGMDTVLKGNFSSPDLGSLTVCLDPRTGPYLHCSTEDGRQYLLGSSTGADTLALWRQLSP